MSEGVIQRLPDLRSPIMIVGFAGWANAGEVSTASVLYIMKQLEAARFAHIPIDRFHDFQSVRPLVEVHQGIIRSLEFRANEFFYWKSETSPHDLIIFHGIEPQFLWGEFIRSFFHVVQPYRLERIVSIGGVFDHVPHTMDPPISAVVTREEYMEQLTAHGIVGTQYAGPASVHSLILTEAERRGIPSISLWGHAPSYIQAQNPKVVRALIQMVSSLIGIEIDLHGLQEPIERMERQLEQAMEEKPELREFVKQLEEHYRKDRPRKIFRDSNVTSFEKWLKKLDGGGDGGKNSEP